MPVNNAIFNDKEWPFYPRQIMLLERGKQILPLCDYIFSTHNLELPDNSFILPPQSSAYAGGGSVDD